MPHGLIVARGGFAALAGWVLGVALQLQQPALWSPAPYAAVLLAGGLALTGIPWLRRAGAAVVLALLAGVLIGVGLTGLRAAHFAADALDPALQGVDIEVTGRIASLPQVGAQGERFDFLVESSRREGDHVTLPPRLQLGWFGGPGASTEGRSWSLGAGSPGLRAGDRWRFTVRLRSPHGNFNPHGFDRERWLWEKGIQATGTVRNGPRDPAPQRLGATWWHPLDSLRQTVSGRIDERVASDPRSAGVIAALVVGDQSAIDRADWDLFRTTGVAHLMSISGLHVTLFAWLATALVGWGWRRLARVWPQALLAVPTPWAAGIGGVLLATAYALFSGWGVPSQRTVLMLAVVVGLRLSVRHWPWPAVWLLAMAVVVALDPWALMQAGFWLSFVAVGILFATDPGRRQTAEGAPWPRRTARALAGLVREQGVVTVALAPLTLLLFGQFSVVGLVANLAAIPWVTLLVTPLALLGVFMPPLWDAAAWAVLGLSIALQWLAQWPWAALFRPVAPWPLAVLAVVGGVLLVLRLPWAMRLAGLMLLWPALFHAPPRPAPGHFELLALDVGQGSAALLRTATHTLLYDTGPRYGPQPDAADAGERVVLPLLRALGERLDAVVVSHSDSDHAGGAAAVQAAQPQARWLSSYDADPARRCVAGQRWQWDGVDFEVLHPQAEHYDESGKGRLSSNAMSCVLRVSNGTHSAWLGGDIDATQEVRLALARPELRATVMLAPHHGSQTSSSPALLNTLQPDWVIVQSGYRNRFNHPAAVVLERYAQRGIPWVSSPGCGAATWRSDSPGEVACERQRHGRYWNHRGR